MTLFYDSSYRRKLFPLLVLFTLLLPISATLHAETGVIVDFRVSGIMRVGKELYRGLVESPDGKKRVVREGEIIDHWKVVSINEQCIILSKETKTYEECISGTGGIQSPEASKETRSYTAPADKTEYKSVSANRERIKHVDKAELLQSLDGLALKEGDLTMEAISEAVLPLTDLPEGFRITEINARIPKSAQNALVQMRQDADLSRLIRLTFKNEADNQNVIYLQTTTQPPGKR
jgi:hypothetical protein